MHTPMHTIMMMHTLLKKAGGILQDYSGTSCNDTLTQNYGYRNGACIPSGYLYDDDDDYEASSDYYVSVVYNNSDCSTATLRRYYDGHCQQLASITPIGEQTECQQIQPAGLAFTSVNFFCVFLSGSTRRHEQLDVFLPWLESQ